MRPLVIDLCCGLGGWSEGFLSEGYECIGFDIERRPYPGQLVLQDITTLHGSQFRNAAVIVASPPCQAYSYRAMPWKRAKAVTPDPLPAWWNLPEYRRNSKVPCMGLQDMAEWNLWKQRHPQPPPSNELFDTCFRIQREASEATTKDCMSCGGKGFAIWYVNDCRQCERCDGKGFTQRYIPMVVENVKGAQPWVGRAKWHYGSFFLWGDVPALMPNGNWRKGAGGTWFHENNGGQRRYNSKDERRLELQAQIAKIPFPLAQHIARIFKPDQRTTGM